LDASHCDVSGGALLGCPVKGFTDCPLEYELSFCPCCAFPVNGSTESLVYGDSTSWVEAPPVYGSPCETLVLHPC
jgi:hypothetical protein